MSGQVDQEIATRKLLEELAAGTMEDAVLVAIMEEHGGGNTETCAAALLELMGTGVSPQEHENQREQVALEEERKELESYKAESREQQQAQELHELRAHLEAEWRERIEADQAALRARAEELEREKQALIEKQLGLVANRHAVEEAMQEVRKERAAAEREARERKADSSQQQQRHQQDSPHRVNVQFNASPAVVTPGTKLVVYWDYVEGEPSSSDWIGFYKRSRPAESNGYYVYQKTGGLRQGSMEFTVPAKLGICELRFFRQNSYVITARSEPLVVGNSVCVHAEVRGQQVRALFEYGEKSSPSSWDWAAVYSVEGDEMMGSYQYLKARELSFPLPRRPGAYDVRYFQSGSGISELARSNSFVVEDTDVLRGEVARDSKLAVVSWHLESVDVFRSADWVGLFRDGPINPLAVLRRQETHCKQPQGTLKFPLEGVPPGRYVFAFFRKGTGRPVKRSNSVTID